MTGEGWRFGHKRAGDVDLLKKLGEESGFDVARGLVQDKRGEEAAVVLISTHTEADFADLIAESPAAGFLPKADLSATAIRRILDGRSS